MPLARSSLFSRAGLSFFAPMEGVTDAVVRQHWAQQGALDVVCTEFVRVSAHPLSAKTLRESVCETPAAILSVQIMGNDPALMADSAARMAQAGAPIIDINLGCPTKRALKGNVGAAMLRDRHLLESVLTAMRAAIPGIFSAKMRAGFDASGQHLEIARVIAACGIDFIIVHPRKRSDFYQGQADWSLIAAIREHLDLPVIGNGDIIRPADAQRMLRQTGAAGYMIGRGALRNPWLFLQSRQLLQGLAPLRPTPMQVLQFWNDLRQSCLAQTPGRPQAVLGRFKELSGYFTKLFPGGELLRQRIVRHQDPQAMWDDLAAFIMDIPAAEWEALWDRELDGEAVAPAISLPGYGSKAAPCPAACPAPACGKDLE